MVSSTYSTFCKIVDIANERIRIGCPLCQINVFVLFELMQKNWEEGRSMEAKQTWKVKFSLETVWRYKIGLRSLPSILLLLFPDSYLRPFPLRRWNLHKFCLFLDCLMFVCTSLSLCISFSFSLYLCKSFFLSLHIYFWIANLSLSLFISTSE